MGVIPRHSPHDLSIVTVGVTVHVVPFIVELYGFDDAKVGTGVLDYKQKIRLNESSL